MPSVHLATPLPAQQARDLYAYECRLRGRVAGSNGLQRRDPATDSERLTLAAEPLSQVRPHVLCGRHGGAE